jgi:hypothetical protein
VVFQSWEQSSVSKAPGEEAETAAEKELQVGPQSEVLLARWLVAAGG